MNRVDAKIIEQDDSIYLLKYCPEHGEQRALLEKNAAWYLARAAYDKPGTESRVQTPRNRGCPYDCGLCPEHDQHTCIALIEVTKDCDLHCPTCYADSSSGGLIDLETAGRMMDFYQDSEFGNAEILQFSGGEPTTHPEILELLRLAMTKGFKTVMLNTNGLRIAEDRAFTEALAEFGSGFEVYLQFDGFDPETMTHLRGRDLSEQKQRAVSRLVELEIPVTLVSTIEKGVNDHEIGRIIRFAMDTPCVRGVNFQPLAFFGRLNRGQSEDRMTLTEILELAETQTDGLVRMSDFIPLPCNVERVAITYFYRSKGTFTPITRNVDLKKFLPLIKNTFAFDADDFIEDTHRMLMASSSACDCMKNLLCGLRPIIPESYEHSDEEAKVRYVNENTFRISVSSFVDAYNFDTKSMKKECVHILTPDLRRIPFSAYNMLYREHERSLPEIVRAD